MLYPFRCGEARCLAEAIRERGAGGRTRRKGSRREAGRPGKGGPGPERGLPEGRGRRRGEEGKGGKRSASSGTDARPLYIVESSSPSIVENSSPSAGRQDRYDEFIFPVTRNPASSSGTGYRLKKSFSRPLDNSRALALSLGGSPGTPLFGSPRNRARRAAPRKAESPPAARAEGATGGDISARARAVCRWRQSPD